MMALAASSASSDQVRVPSGLTVMEQPVTIQTNNRASKTVVMQRESFMTLLFRGLDRACGNGGKCCRWCGLRRRNRFRQCVC